VGLGWWGWDLMDREGNGYGEMIYLKIRSHSLFHSKLLVFLRIFAIRSQRKMALPFLRVA
jgi:hypothetical protein